MYKAVSTFLLVVTGAMAQARSVPDQIEQANKVVKETFGPKELCSSCAANREDDDRPAWRRCMAELCPVKTPSEIKLENSAGFDGGSQIPRAVRAMVRRQKIHDEHVLKAIENNEKISDPELKAQYRIVKGMRNFGLLLVDELGKVDSNATQERFLAAGLTSADYDMTMKSLATEEGVQASLPKLFRNGTEDLSATQIQKQAQRILSETETLEKKVSKRLNLSPSFLAGDERVFLKTKIESGQITDATLKMLEDYWRSAKFMNSVRSGKDTSSDIEMGKEVSRAAAVQLKARIQAAEEYLAGRPQPTSPFGHLALSCLEAKYLGDRLSPDAAQIAKFRNVEKEMRKLFVERSRKFLSAHSSNILEGEAKDWKIAKISTKDDFNNDFNSWLETNIVENESSIAVINASKENERKLLVVNTVSDSEAPAEDLYLFKELKSVCHERVPGVRKDFARQGKLQDTIGFSGRTVTDDVVKTDIMFHEYSHMASRLIGETEDMSKETRGWYKDVRACLNSQHGNGLKFEEEDFAEMFGAATGVDAVDYLCDVNWDTDRTEQLINLLPSEYDKHHSGPFYSLLMKRHVRAGSIPESCHQALLEKGETRLPENCLKKTASAASR